MHEQVTDELNALRKSVTFAMSLGAKELFHTNFLAFILEIKSEDKSQQGIRNNLANLFGITIGKSTKIYTWREKYNLDLVIIAIDWKNATDEQEGIVGIEKASVCVIEAKLKSIPTLEQLKEYDTKLKKGINFELNDSDYLQWSEQEKVKGFKLTFDGNNGNLKPLIEGKPIEINLVPCVKKILLSQIEPQQYSWELITWCKIAEILQTTMPVNNNVEDSNLALNSIVNDYVVHLKNLANLITKVIAYSNENFNSDCNALYRCICCWTNDANFKQIRIHDLVGKVVFNDLENRLLSQIPGYEHNSIKLRSYTHYSNQRPGIGFEWQFEGSSEKNEKGRRKTKKVFSIGVQIQGSDYRHYISTTTEWDRLGDLSQIDCLQKQWFTGNGFYQRQNGNGLYAFNANKFLFSQKNIDELTFNKLGECLKESMNLACLMSSDKKIQDLITDYLNPKSVTSN